MLNCQSWPWLFLSVPLCCVPYRFARSHLLSLQASMIRVPRHLQVPQRFPGIQAWSLPVIAQWGLPRHPCQHHPPLSRSVRAPARQLGPNTASRLIRSRLLLRDAPPVPARLQRSRSTASSSTWRRSCPVTAGTGSEAGCAMLSLNRLPEPVRWAR